MLFDNLLGQLAHAHCIFLECEKHGPGLVKRLVCGTLTVNRAIRVFHKGVWQAKSKQYLFTSLIQYGPFIKYLAKSNVVNNVSRIPLTICSSAAVLQQVDFGFQALDRVIEPQCGSLAWRLQVCTDALQIQTLFLDFCPSLIEELKVNKVCAEATKVVDCQYGLGVGT